jgi:integrase/recombinase XerD
MQANNVQLIASFIGYLRAERGAAANTVASYEIDLQKFAEWLEKPIATVKRTDLQRYISDLLGTGVSSRTTSRRLSCLRTFYQFLIDEGEVQTDPTRNLPVPKTWRTVPKSLSLADLEKMIASLGASWLDVRDKAMLLTFFASGLRASELADLKMCDLNLEGGAAKIWNGKGRKDGIVPLGPPAIAALKLYFGTVRPKFGGVANSAYVFLSRRGQRLTRQQIYYRVRDIAQAALGKRVGAHQLRHGFGTALVEGGADIRDVQVLMRHSSVDTTAIYVHTDLKYLRRIYYASHPRARLAEAAG